MYCPFAHCTQHIRGDKPIGFTNKNTLKHHLQDCHKSDLYKLTDDQLESNDLYICRQCDEYVCDTEAQLKTHLGKHYEHRTAANFELVTKYLYEEVDCVHRNHWEEGLAFLRSNTLAPPTFRQSLITFIKHKLETNIVTTLYHLLLCCVELSA